MRSRDGDGQTPACALFGSTVGRFAPRNLDGNAAGMQLERLNTASLSAVLANWLVGMGWELMPDAALSARYPLTDLRAN